MVGPRVTDSHIAEQLGMLRQAFETWREEKGDFKTELQNLRQAVNGLQQSNITTNAILADLAKQGISERLNKIEGRMTSLEAAILTSDQIVRFKEMDTSYRRWTIWLKSGKSLLWRIALALVTCSVGASLIIGAILHILGFKAH